MRLVLQGNANASDLFLGRQYVASPPISFAVADGSIKSLQELVSDYVPVLKGRADTGVSIRDVLETSSGINFNDDYAELDSGINQ